MRDRLFRRKQTKKRKRTITHKGHITIVENKLRDQRELWDDDLISETQVTKQHRKKVARRKRRRDRIELESD